MPTRFGSIRALTITLAILALTAGASVAVWMQLRTSDSTEIPADTSFLDLNGNVRSLNEWRGKTVLVNFWATWCAPCREEIPLLNQAAVEFEAKDIQIVGVAVDELSDVVAFRKKIPISYPVWIGDLSTLSLMARYGNQSGVLPYSVVLDEEGRVIDQKTGAYRAGELKMALNRAISSKK